MTDERKECLDYLTNKTNVELPLISSSVAKANNNRVKLK